jgi:hypothetical protein
LESKQTPENGAHETITSLQIWETHTLHHDHTQGSDFVAEIASGITVTVPRNTDFEHVHQARD